MRITEILNSGRPSLSFEVFPPKTDTAIESVTRATEQIAALGPSFMSVTYGAGGGTSKYTLEIARGIERTYGVPTLAHLTCISSTRDTVRRRLAEMSELGIRNVMALRGDIPTGFTDADRARLDYRHAVDLIDEIKTLGYDFCIGAACYPEVHPESISAEDDIRHLRDKVEAGADFLTTQMFFDNELYYSFLDRARDAGITVPVVAGIMPITTFAQIGRAVELSGSYVPPRFLSLVERFRDDPDAVKEVGIEYATEQILDLYAHGVKGVHVYSMNKPDVAAKIKENLCEVVIK